MAHSTTENRTIDGGPPGIRAIAMALRALAIAAIAYPPCHAAALCLRMILSCPEGVLRPAAFFAMAAIAIAGPGVAALSMANSRGRFRERVLLALSCGISATGLYLWLACAAGALCDTAIVIWLVACLASICRFAPASVRSALAARAAASRFALWSSSQPLASLLRAAAASMMACSIFESAVATPFSAWDAAVSWDKWAVDFASRNSMGGYLTGGYPLFIPLFNSMFYRMAGSAGDVLPPEQMLVHGLFAIYPAILMLSLSCLGARHRFSGLAAFLFLAASQYVFGDMAVGQADIPMLSMTLAAAALVPELARSTDSRPAAFTACTLLFFAPVFMKGTGVCWALTASAYCAFCRTTPPGHPRRMVFAAFFAALALAMPFAMKTLYLSVHPESVEKSPALLVFPLRLAHNSIFTPDLRHLWDWLGKLAFDRLLFIGHGLAPAAAGIPAAILLAAALASRRTRGLTLFSAATLAAWFFFASYDIRNAEAPLCLLAVAAAMLLRDALSMLRDFEPPPLAWTGLPFNFLLTRHPVRAAKDTAAILVAISWCALTVPALAHAPLDAVAALASHPRPPAPWTGGVPARLRLFKPASDLVNILETAPYGRAARHVVACDRLYRLFGVRGVYAIQQNGAGARDPGDIFLRCPSWAAAPGAPFVLAGAISRAAPYRELWLACPESAPHDSPFELRETSLSVSGAPPCGLLEIFLPENAERPSGLGLSRACMTDEAALYAEYVKPVRDGRALRLVYWTGSGASPVFDYSGQVPERVAIRAFPF